MYKTLIAIFSEGYETLASLVHETIQLATFACSACSENKGEKKKPKERREKDETGRKKENEEEWLIRR